MRVLLLAVLLAAGAGAAGSAQAAGGAVPPLVPRELASLAEESHALVQVERGATATATSRVLRRAGGELVSEHLRIWRVPSAAAVRLLPGLALAEAVAEVEPDRPRRPLDHLAAGDELLPHQWWIAPIGADQVEPPGPGVPVTVVDGGVDLAHPELAGRPNTFALNEQTIRPNDYHGTAVASVVAAPANGIGIVGVYPQAVLRTWDASPGTQLTTAAIIRGIETASASGRGVINLSLGGVFFSPFEAQAVATAYHRGSIVVAASGNDREHGNLPSFPASLPHVLTVGAVGQDLRVAPFSSSSPGMDLAAPGVGLPVAVPVALDPSGFRPLDGTSFAAPLAAGAVAWVWTQRPELEKTQVFELIRRSARDLEPAGRNADTGFGLLDIPRALTMPAPPVDPLEPNDELAHVIPGRLFAAGKPPLTRPGAGRAVLNARVDVTDDPRDIYRVWAPTGHRVVVTLAGPATVELRYAGPTAIRRTSRIGARRLELTNRLARGQFVYVTALIRPGAQPTTASYRLAITTTRAPAPARR